MDDEIPVLVSSGYGGNTRRGFVSLRLGDQTPHTMSSAEARRVAGLLLECAEAADQDAFMVDYFMQTLGLDLEQAAWRLQDFRFHRAERMTPDKP